jgi:hypothetical protein
MEHQWRFWGRIDGRPGSAWYDFPIRDVIFDLHE